MARFIGRDVEIDQLLALTKKPTSSLATIQGRRRIGKSTLVRHFARLHDLLCFEFQGLPPRPHLTNRDQLDEFAKGLSARDSVQCPKLLHWTQAFEQLHLFCLKQRKRNKKMIILLDEISWMGGKDPDFAGALKDVWDRLLSQNNQLILILCGSVSSWIQKNILENTGYVGRISKEFHLKELSIAESAQLLKASNRRASPREIAQILAVTGGVPKYLEEIAPYKQTIVGLRELCFQPSGLLFGELEFIFSEIFGKKNPIYLEVLENLCEKKLTPAELAIQMNHPLNGDWTVLLSNLELAGFITRDLNWNFNGSESKQSKLRVSDNYARFYLKYIRPRKKKLVKLPLDSNSNLDFLPWNTIFGLQFENLILNNYKDLLHLAGLPTSEVLQLGPYFQSATKVRSSVQIDCLVQCRRNVLHVFEIKSGAHLGSHLIDEAIKKEKQLKVPRGFSVRHHLVYLGELSESLRESDFFDTMISFERFLKV